MNDAARLIIASGGNCCANCIYAQDPAHPNPFRPAVLCGWLEKFPRLPLPADGNRVLGSWKSELPPEQQGCKAWEKKGQ